MNHETAPIMSYSKVSLLVCSEGDSQWNGPKRRFFASTIFIHFICIFNEIQREHVSAWFCVFSDNCWRDDTLATLKGWMWRCDLIWASFKWIKLRTSNVPPCNRVQQWFLFKLLNGAVIRIRRCKKTINFATLFQNDKAQWQIDQHSQKQQCTKPYVGTDLIWRN